MNCKNCKADCAERGFDTQKQCAGYIPTTNGDNVRRMENDELLRLLISECPPGRTYSPFGWCENGALNGNCTRCWKAWLNERADGES